MTMYTGLSHETPTARKDHRCTWCGEKILKGEKYHHIVGVYDGLQNDRFHNECREDMNLNIRDMDYEFMPYENERPKKD